MAMVSNKFFGAVAVKLGFHKHLKHSANMLIAQITEYALDIQQAVESAGGAMDYWMATKDPPKVKPYQICYGRLQAHQQSAYQILSKPMLAQCSLTQNSTIDK